MLFLAVAVFGWTTLLGMAVASGPTLSGVCTMTVGDGSDDPRPDRDAVARCNAAAIERAMSGNPLVLLHRAGAVGIVLIYLAGLTLLTATAVFASTRKSRAPRV